MNAERVAPPRWLAAALGAVAIAALGAPGLAQTATIELEVPPDSTTTAESSGWTATSTHQDVLSLLEALRSEPVAARLTVRALGTSEEGRELPLVIAAEPACADPAAVHASGKLRILINANIHGGEVEGKEASQILLRELAQGEHRDLLADAVLLFVPIFNADGNDRIDRRNRVAQNGPSAGVGERANAQNRDLNRDFVKAETAEVRALLAAFQAYDPHVFVDLHTTNGSYHGYHLTYAPCLSTNVDPTLDAFARRTLLPEVRAALAEQDWRTYDYGNFRRGGAQSWNTYDHRPRFGTNYFGLRNRLSFLAEAYSYVPYRDRVAVTRAFVLSLCQIIVAHADDVRRHCADADARLVEDGASIEYGYDTELEPAKIGRVLVGSVERIERPDGLGMRLVASPEYREVEMPVRTGFQSKQHQPLPAGWALPRPSQEVIATLQRHGVVLERWADPVEVEAEEYVPRTVTPARREFQGHFPIELRGALSPPAAQTLPAGSLLIRANQRLGRVAAQLLEACSEDSLATWNYFDEALRPDPDSGVKAQYPVLRLRTLPAVAPEPIGG
ncbi:MAG: M14 family metallopeptidase [Planctomycetota bacterium]